MMPKDIHTPRGELVCGKLEAIAKELSHLGRFKQNTEAVVRIMYMHADITHDCERMEQKLITRKQEVRDFEELKTLCKELLDGANKCAEEPHFIVQPFFGIVKCHVEIIKKHELL